VVPSRVSGFYVPNQSNHIKALTDNKGRKLVIAGQNNDKIKVFTVD
jgi:hypothetical protein